MTVYGWDASNYDDPIRVRDGIDFYTHKAAEGHHNYYDREYRASLEAARDLDIPILGAYFVNHPGTVADQVDWFVQILDQDTPWWREHPCFVLQIDAEKFEYMSRAPTLAEIQAFGDRLVEVHGVDPRRVLAYAPRWLYGDSLTGLSYRLWASNYGSNPYAHYRDCYPGDGSSRWVGYSGQSPLLLQYGSNTTIGDQATCDANAYRGTLDELLAELGATDPPEDDMTPEQSRQLYNLDRLHTALLLDADEVTQLDDGQGNKVTYALMIVRRQKQILTMLQAGGGNPDSAAIIAAVRGEADATRAEVRDAVADLGEGGAAAVRADPDA